MSDRKEILFISDIADSAGAILEYTKGLAYEDFHKDRKTFAAVIREFEIIGEAVSKISDDIKKSYPNIEWQDIKDFRNILIHEYFGIDSEIVWKIIQDDLPILSSAIREILTKQDIDV